MFYGSDCIRLFFLFFFCFNFTETYVVFFHKHCCYNCHCWGAGSELFKYVTFCTCKFVLVNNDHNQSSSTIKVRLLFLLFLKTDLLQSEWWTYLMYKCAVKSSVSKHDQHLLSRWTSDHNHSPLIIYPAVFHLCGLNRLHVILVYSRSTFWMLSKQKIVLISNIC